MTILEALNEIRSKTGWYYLSDGNGGIKPVSTLIGTAQRIEDGRCKPDTIKRFFEQFGYKVETSYLVTKLCGTPGKNK